jgi:TRAP-type C4-dicarboxylate transport system permease small subunit
MRQVNFLLIFSFGLATVMFTLENTAPTTVHFLPGLKATMPLAALLLVVGGVGATAAWVFAVWSGVVKKVEAIQNQSELEAQQVRIQELENDLQRYRATVDAQLGLLPAAGQSSASEA